MISLFQPFEISSILFNMPSIKWLEFSEIWQRILLLWFHLVSLIGSQRKPLFQFMHHNTHTSLLAQKCLISIEVFDNVEVWNYSTKFFVCNAGLSNTISSTDFNGLFYTVQFIFAFIFYRNKGSDISHMTFWNIKITSL